MAQQLLLAELLAEVADGRDDVAVTLVVAARAGADIHASTTAEEILRDFGQGLDYRVTGFGTGGTLNGVARVLKERSPSTRVVVAEPENSVILASGHIQAMNSDGSAAESHRGFRTANGVKFEGAIAANAYSFLPKWLHPR